MDTDGHGWTRMTNQFFVRVDPWLRNTPLESIAGPHLVPDEAVFFVCSTAFRQEMNCLKGQRFWRKSVLQHSRASRLGCNAVGGHVLLLFANDGSNDSNQGKAGDNL